MTQLEQARKGNITKELKTVARKENIAAEDLTASVAKGTVVIPCNHNHQNVDPIGIGAGLRTKVNANIGTSGDFSLMENEIEKINRVIRYKADTVMDLSTGGDISRIRRALIRECTIPFGNVPIYQMVVDFVQQNKPFVDLRPENMLAYIREQAEDGVDYMTIHAGLTMKAVEKIRFQGREADIVSRGGSLITGWILHNEKENPLYVHFDRILEIAREHDVTLSLGDGLRPGCLADGTDWGQVEELLTLGELVRRCRDAGVQVMVEGPGHLPLDQVEMNVKMQKSLCENAPFYVLGPLVTDIAAGYDHITAAIGGAVAASAGADFLCYVTPAEHLGLPNEDDVREGIMASRIAAHAADIVKKVPGAMQQDLKMSRARKELDWKTQQQCSIDPERFSQVRENRRTSSEACSMCGEYCVYKILKNRL